LPAAARVAEILHPTLDLGARVGRLAIRLTYGVPSAAVDLARVAGADLLRGDYCRLASADLCEPEAIERATDDQLLACVDGDRRKLSVLHDASTQVIRWRAQTPRVYVPMLEAYVA
jgi:helicase